MQLSEALNISSGDIVSLVGGGGKTTAMFRLASELVAKNKRVLTTTSTRIFAAQTKLSPASISFNPKVQNLADVLVQMDKSVKKHGQVLLFGKQDATSGKAFGVEPEIIASIAASNLFDVIINEADGSRMRAFKAPAEHEPVVPICTTIVVPVVGMDILHRPLNADNVHRAEHISRICCVAPESPLTVEIIYTVLTHPLGGLKNAPPNAMVIPLLNRPANATNETVEEIRQLAMALLENAVINRVALGNGIAQPIDLIETK